MQTTTHRVVLVRNIVGEVVHTHEVIDFDDVTPLSEAELFDAAITAAMAAHPRSQEELAPRMATKEELDRLRTERGNPMTSS